MGPYVAQAGGYLRNPNDSAACEYCQYSVGDQFYTPLEITYSDRGLYLVYFLVYSIVRRRLVVLCPPSPAVVEADTPARLPFLTVQLPAHHLRRTLPHEPLLEAVGGIRSPAAAWVEWPSPLRRVASLLSLSGHPSACSPLVGSRRFVPTSRLPFRASLYFLSSRSNPVGIAFVRLRFGVPPRAHVESRSGRG